MEEEKNDEIISNQHLTLILVILHVENEMQRNVFGIDRRAVFGSNIELLLCYPYLYAIMTHSIWWWKLSLLFSKMCIRTIFNWFTGIYIQL